jgi:hypothetical protein
MRRMLTPNGEDVKRSTLYELYPGNVLKNQ